MMAATVKTCQIHMAGVVVSTYPCVKAKPEPSAYTKSLEMIVSINADSILEKSVRQSQAISYGKGIKGCNEMALKERSQTCAVHQPS